MRFSQRRLETVCATYERVLDTEPWAWRVQQEVLAAERPEVRNGLRGSVSRR